MILLTWRARNLTRNLRIWSLGTATPSRDIPSSSGGNELTIFDIVSFCVSRLKAAPQKIESTITDLEGTDILSVERPTIVPMKDVPTHGSPVFRRRRVSASVPLWIMMALVMAIAVVLAVHMREVKLRRQAIAVLQKSGNCSWAFDGYDPFSGRMTLGGANSILAGSRARKPNWIERRLGEEFFQSLERVYFSPRGSLGESSAGGRPEGAELVSDAAINALSRLRGLKYVTIHRCRISPRDIQRLSKVRSVAHLRFVDVEFESGAVEAINLLSSVESVWIEHAKASENKVRLFAKLNKLRRLYMECSKLDQRGLDQLSQLQQIENLGLWGVAPGLDVRSLGQLTGLKSLDLDSNDLTDYLLPDFRNLRQLESLDLSGNESILFTGVRGIEELRSMKKLSMRLTGLGNEGLRQLAKLENVGELDLSSCEFTDAGLISLQHLKRLRKLDLTLCRHISDPGLHIVSTLAGLRELRLVSDRVTDNGVSYLGHLTSLRKLDLSYTGVKALEGLDVSRLNQLRELNLTSTPLTPRGLAKVLQLRCLRRLDLRGAMPAITDSDIKRLGRLSALEDLSLPSSSVTTDGIKHLHSLSHLNRLCLGKRLFEQSEKMVKKMLPLAELESYNYE